VGENNLNSVAKNNDADMQAQVEASTHMLYFFAIVFAIVVLPGILYVLCFSSPSSTATGVGEQALAWACVWARARVEMATPMRSGRGLMKLGS
jgi:hypothetical protein